MRDMANNICKNMTMDQSDTATVKSRISKSIFQLISIVIANLFLMLIALKTGLSITELIWLYWCEGVIVGLIQLLKVFSVESTSATVIDYLRSDEPPIGLTICFLCLEVPLHGFFFPFLTPVWRSDALNPGLSRSARRTPLVVRPQKEEAPRAAHSRQRYVR